MVAIVIAMAASRLPDRLQSGSGDIAGSTSLRVDGILKSEFPYGEGPALVLAMRSASLDRRPTDSPSLFFELKLRWYEDPLVADVALERDLSDRRLLPARRQRPYRPDQPDRRGPPSGSSRRSRGFAPRWSRCCARRSGATPISNGRSPVGGALTFDLNRFMAEDSARAELLACR